MRVCRRSRVGRHDRDADRELAATRPGTDRQADVGRRRWPGPAVAPTERARLRRRHPHAHRAWAPRVERARLDEREPRHIAEQRRDLPTRARSPRPRAASRARPAACPIASDQVVSPSAQMCSPSARGRAPRPPRRGRRRSPPGVTAPIALTRTSTASSARVGRDLRVVVAAAAPRRAARPPSTRRCRSIGTCDGDVGPRPRARRRGITSSAHIGRISRGGPGSATATPPSGRRHEPARGRAIRVGERLARWDPPRLLEVDLGERQATSLPAGTQPRLDVGVDDGRLTEAPRRSIRGSGRPASARGRRCSTTRSARSKAAANASADDVEPIGQRHDPDDR